MPRRKTDVSAIKTAASRSRYLTKESVLHEIKRRKEKNFPLNSRSLQKGAYRDSSLYNRGTSFFGCWQGAIKKAGLQYEKPVRKSRSPYPTKDAVLEEIHRRINNGVPVNSKALQKGTFADHSLSGQATIRFGSWRKAVEAAGLVYHEVCIFGRYPTKEAVLKEILQRKKTGLPLNSKSLERSGPFKDDRLYRNGKRLFGTWKAAIEAAGIRYQDITLRKQRFPDEKTVIKEIRKRKRNGLPLNARSLIEGKLRDIHLYSRAYAFFGSWRAAIEAAGFNYRKISLHGPTLYPTKESIVLEILRRKKEQRPLNATALLKGRFRDLGLYYQTLALFGNWETAIEASGLDYHKILLKHPSLYPIKADVLNEIRRRAHEKLPLNAQALKKGNLRNFNLHYQGTVLFGDWRRAVEAAGFRYEDIAIRGRYPTGEAIIRAILERVREGLPLNAGELCQGESYNQSLYNSGLKQFGQWVYALLIAWMKGSEADRIAMRPVLEELILRELNRRTKKGLSLVSANLSKGSEEEAALVSAARKIFGNWPTALRAADVAWDGKGIARFARARRIR
jgi:hypothetical protein